MAKRYSGNLAISVVYDDKGHYRTSVSSGGKLLWRGIVNPAPAGFGPGVAYDSPKAYDEVASSALAFADDEIRGIGDEAESNEELTGYLIRRTPRKTQQHGARIKKPKIVVRKIGARWQPIDARGTVVRGKTYNADGTGYSTRAGAAEAAQMFRLLGDRA